MRDLQKIYEECLAEVKALNIPIRDEKIVEIKSEMLDENYGLCEYDGSYNFDIVIDERLLRDECPLKELKEVVIHELIHTCPRCLSHSNTWRKYARIMNDVYGYALLASGGIDHLESGENDQFQSDRNNQCISFSFL